MDLFWSEVATETKTDCPALTNLTHEYGWVVDMLPPFIMSNPTVLNEVLAEV